MCWTFFIFVWCLCIQPVLMLTTSWELVTSPAVFGKPVELRCTVVGNSVSCCSQLTRIWNRGLIDILNNGNTRFPSKYRETLDAPNKQFSLIINNLTKDDVDVVYTCAYGNYSPQKTLTQNDSFEYHPTESYCPVKIDHGKLVGTLSVAMVAPYPSVFAQYGGKNFTSSLKTVIAAMTNSSKFYNIRSQIEINPTCGHDEKFTLSVLTGVTTTNICNDVDICDCVACAGFCCVYSTVPTVIGCIIILITILSLHTPCLQTMTEDNTELNAKSGSPEQSRLLQDTKADKKVSSLSSLLRIFFGGFGPETVYGEKGTFIIFIFPYEVNATTKVNWYRVKHTSADQITDGDLIITNSPIKDRLSIVKENKTGKFHLQLSDLRESDEGVYRCSFGKQEKEYKLIILAPCTETVPEDNTELEAVAPCLQTVTKDNTEHGAIAPCLQTVTKDNSELGAIAPCLQTVTKDNSELGAIASCLQTVTKDNTEHGAIAPCLQTVTKDNTEHGAIAPCLQTMTEDNTELAAIDSGADNPESVYGTKGKPIIFIFPYEGSATTEVLWYHVKPSSIFQITDGDHIRTDSPQKDRVSIFKDYITGKFHLQLSDLRESDEGVYRCSFGKQEKEYKLKVLDPEVLTKLQKMLVGIPIFVMSAALNATFAIPLGYYICFCIVDETDPLFILLGVFTCAIATWIVWFKIRGYLVAEKIYGIKGSSIIIKPCLSTTTTVKWQRVTLWTNIDISDGCDLAESPIKDRVCIVGGDTAEEYNLKLSNIQKSDQVLYKCIVGKQDKFYKLELLDSKLEKQTINITAKIRKNNL